MHRPLQRLLLIAMLLGGLALGAAGQNAPEAGTGKKADPEKSADPLPPKGKDSAKGKTDKGKVPTGPIIVPKDTEKRFSLWPSLAVQLSLEEYQALIEKQALQKPFKVEKKPASHCELSGKLEGDYVNLRAEFTFSTEDPRTIIILGLKGAQLTEMGDLDGQLPFWDYTPDEGFNIRVDKPGDHRLVVPMRVRVVSKGPASGAGTERGFDIQLPGTAITRISLELPQSVKEVRWNDTAEKNRVLGKWFFSPTKEQKLAVSWRESAAQLGGGPHLSAEGKIKVALRDTDAEISAELVLEDPRGQTKECQLMLPPQADVKVTAPQGSAYELIPPSPKNAAHILRFLEPNTGQWLVTAFARVPRPAPGARLPVGPFYVQGAEHQRGTITVLAPAELLRKQKLIYHRFGEVFQRDPPKAPDVEAVFQYWGLPNPTKVKMPAGSRVPLEMEFKSERGPLEASVDQVLKLRPNGEGWEIDLTARVHVKSPSGGGDFIDLQMPRPRPFGVSALAAAPAAPFPAALPWPGLEVTRGPVVAWAIPLQFQVSEEGGGALELTPTDAAGRCRVLLSRSLGKSFTLTITGKYAVAPQSQRARVGLPHVLGMTEQGGKFTAQTEESFELLVGPRGLEEPVPEKHRYQFNAGETPDYLDLAWRRYRPQFPAESVIDVVVHGRTAQIRQRLSFGAPPRPSPSQLPRVGQVQLDVPPGVRGITVVKGDRRTPLEAEKGSVWVSLDAKEPREILLEYDLAVSEPAAAARLGGPRTLSVQTVWPRLATRQSAKLRVWCDPGTRVRLADADAAGALWQDRGVEPVPGHDVLPAMVLRGNGPQLPLTIGLEDSAGGGIAALLCERALIQAEVGDDDGLACRARYLLSRINAEWVEVEFPVPVAQCQLEVRLGDFKVPWEESPASRNVARIPLRADAAAQPVVLDIRYKLSATTQDWRLFGLTTMYPPVFHQAVVVDKTRWSLSLPSDTVAVPVSAGARPDYRWGLDRFLLCPLPSVTGAAMDSWLTGREPVDPVPPVSFSFARTSQEPQRVYHLQRLWWVALLSSLVVIVFLVVVFLPIARLGRGIVGGLLGALCLAVGLAWPTLVPSLFYGSQPALVVIVLVLVGLWLLQTRYRRQLAIIPGFTRLKSGSSLIRNGSSKRPRDPSTIDAPVPSGVAGPGTTSSKKQPT